jgi:hypothetical protein
VKVRGPRARFVPSITPPLLTVSPLYRWQGKASQGSQEGRQGLRRRRSGFPGEEARRYEHNLDTPPKALDGGANMQQRRRLVRRWRPRLAARVPSTPAPRASRRAARNKVGPAFCTHGTAGFWLSRRRAGDRRRSILIWGGSYGLGATCDFYDK